MNAQIDRGWKFLHPGVEAGEEEGGLAISNRGGIEMVEGSSAIRQSLRLLLSTTPGERVMRPQYGCEINKLIFLPNDETTKGLAIYYVRRAVERWEPRAKIVRLDAVQDPEVPGRLLVILEYRIGKSQFTESLSVDLLGKPN